jgi:hypothetical protein
MTAGANVTHSQRSGGYSSSADPALALQHPVAEHSPMPSQQGNPKSQHSFPSTQHCGGESQHERLSAQHAFPSAQQAGFSSALQQARPASQHFRFFWQQSPDETSDTGKSGDCDTPGTTPIAATVSPAVAKTTANSLVNIMTLLCG